MRFVDTNVLLYAISTDPDEREKAVRANEILTNTDLAVSVQVLQEFFVQSTRASRADRITRGQACDLITAISRFPVQETTVEVLNAALVSCETFNISLWDAAIIEAARAVGADVVLSEDLNDGQDYHGVIVHNPFR